MDHHDLLLRGGNIVDPASGLSGESDIAVRGGVISAVGDLRGHSASQDIDVSGYLVTPGLVDIHTHVYPRLPYTSDCLPCLPPDVPALSNGVTSIVDAGTCGETDFPAFYEDIIQRSKVRIYALINISRYGMLYLAKESRCASFYPSHVAEIARAYAGVVVGIKSAHYRTSPPFDSTHPAWASVDAALEAGSMATLPVMLDVFPVCPERSYPDLLAHMRPGDIHAHVFAPHIPGLDCQGRVADWMWEARERGVLFDMAHGGKSFCFTHAVPAVNQGFYPDSISSDLYMSSALDSSISLPHVMSKCLAMGMPLDEVVLRSTYRPAQMLNLPDTGSLKTGARADIAVFKIMSEPLGFTDAFNLRLPADRYLNCRMTVLAGDVVYNPYGLGCAAFPENPERLRDENRAVDFTPRKPEAQGKPIHPKVSHDSWQH